MSLPYLQKGDVVKITQTMQVVHVNGSVGYTFSDVQDGTVTVRYLRTDGDYGSLKVEMVKKAAPTPKAGDILTGQEIRERQWKQGTVIQCLRHGGLSPLLLSAYGKWIGSHREEFDFDLLVEDADFKLLHVA